jgi:hypothetical protein
VVVSAVLLIAITSRVGYSGAWDGDPSTHNQLVVDAVNRAADEHARGGDALRGFLQCFYTVPRVLGELMQAAAILAFHGFRHVSFAQVERCSAWFSTLWTLAGFLALYQFLRVFFTRLQALAVMPIAGLSGYVLMYANFPRQNMPSHALCWIALWLYVRTRVVRGALPPLAVLAVGALFGAAVAVHYSATYLFFAFVGIEAAIAVQKRAVREPAIALCICFAGASVIWFLIDLFFFVYAGKYPHDTNFMGQTIGEHGSFLEGMVAANARVSSEISSYKLETAKWWFLPGFLFRCFGPIGAFLLAAGAASLPSLWRRASPGAGRASRLALAIVGIITLISIAASPEYFQNARKLMAFYPAWCVLLGMGLFSMSSAAGSGISRVAGASGAPGRRSAYVVVALVCAHFAVFGPALARIYEQRRDAGYMREYLSAHGISRILTAPNAIDSQMAPVQVNVRTLTLSQADQFEYVVLNRLYAQVYTRELMEKLRPIKPLVAFKNQIASPLLWYEFPLRKDFMDFGDRLTNERALYRWSDVRPALSGLCRASP